MKGWTVNRKKILPIAARLDASAAHTGKNVTIAFIDSGFYPHPDLTQPHNRILKYVDILDTAHGEQQFATPKLISWHGMMTSVCAAGNGYLSNGLYKGLASDATVVLIKVADDRGRVAEHNLLLGLEWVLTHRDLYDIDLVNISVGGDREIPHEESLINRAVEQLLERGVVVVVAAGNTGTQRIVPPASTPDVITVGGLDDKNSLHRQDHTLYWSSFGPTVDGVAKPEIIAPAIWIPLPILPETDQFVEAQAIARLNRIPNFLLRHALKRELPHIQLSPDILNQPVRLIRQALKARRDHHKYISAYYKHGDGTSFAAPIVSSVVAQMLEINPGLTPARIKEILIQTAETLPNVPPAQQGHGVINQREALRVVWQGARPLG
ncbi:MAG: S8 family serine peptidase [Acidobacteria bacterium]|nr:S8 family serine peptidase [Acidobacteriota bacterium]MBI3656573.1 S8 family serine peptidase [Acidobacteriota bacterium]